MTTEPRIEDLNIASIERLITPLELKRKRAPRAGVQNQPFERRRR